MKKIAIALLIGTLTGPVLALHGHGFKIISESHVVTGQGAKGWLETDVGGPLNSKYVGATAQTYDASGHIREFIQLQANHFFTIKNETNYKQRYKVRYVIECIAASNIHNLELEVVPGGLVDETAKNYLASQPTQKGRFPITAKTEVTGETTKSSTEIKTLTVN